jgi:type II secretory pathway pseudopilin PulG
VKKHDEGYVLAYVTVVLLLFCLIATMILTGAMKNMTNQQNTIQQMKDRYAAEGMIQQVIANWNSYQWSSYTEENTQIETTGVYYMGKVDGAIKLTASSGTVQITCTVDSNGKYQSFDIGTAPTESTGEVSQ